MKITKDKKFSLWIITLGFFNIFFCVSKSCQRPLNIPSQKIRPQYILKRRWQNLNMNLIGIENILFYSSCYIIRLFLVAFLFFFFSFFSYWQVLTTCFRLKYTALVGVFLRDCKAQKTDSEKWVVSSGRGERVQQPIQQWLRTPHGLSLQACTRVPGFFFSL